MKIRLDTVMAMFADLERGELEGWIARRWVRPEPDGEDFVFAEIDVARVRLLRDLCHAMAVAEDTVPLVLSLLDQLYAARSGLRRLADALAGQPEEVRKAVAATLQQEERRGWPGQAGP